MNKDFLNGIDEHFDRLMKVSGHGRRSGRLSFAVDDPVSLAILDAVKDLSDEDRREVLRFVITLKEKAE